jgi:flagellin-like protein
VNSQGGKNQKMRKLLKSKKALSPVVAAIILIAVTVAVSIAVAAWMGSMTFTFMETEEMKITSIDFITNTLNDQIDVYVLNTGTTDISITTTVRVSGLGATGTCSTTADIVEKGDVNSFSVNLGTGTWTAGSTYTVELLSSKGNKFTYTGTA